MLVATQSGSNKKEAPAVEVPLIKIKKFPPVAFFLGLESAIINWRENNGLNLERVYKDDVIALVKKEEAAIASDPTHDAWDPQTLLWLKVYINVAKRWEEAKDKNNDVQVMWREEIQKEPQLQQYEGGTSKKKKEDYYEKMMRSPSKHGVIVSSSPRTKKKKEKNEKRRSAKTKTPSSNSDSDSMEETTDGKGTEAKPSPEDIRIDLVTPELASKRQQRSNHIDIGTEKEKEKEKRPILVEADSLDRKHGLVTEKAAEEKEKVSQTEIEKLSKSKESQTPTIITKERDIEEVEEVKQSHNPKETLDETDLRVENPEEEFESESEEENDGKCDLQRRGSHVSLNTTKTESDKEEETTTTTRSKQPRHLVPAPSPTRFEQREATPPIPTTPPLRMSKKSSLSRTSTPVAVKHSGPPPKKVTTPPPVKHSGPPPKKVTTPPPVKHIDPPPSRVKENRLTPLLPPAPLLPPPFGLNKDADEEEEEEGEEEKQEKQETEGIRTMLVEFQKEKEEWRQKEQMQKLKQEEMELRFKKLEAQYQKEREEAKLAWESKMLSLETQLQEIKRTANHGSARAVRATSSRSSTRSFTKTKISKQSGKSQQQQPEAKSKTKIKSKTPTSLTKEKLPKETLQSTTGVKARRGKSDGGRRGRGDTKWSKEMWDEVLKRFKERGVKIPKNLTAEQLCYSKKFDALREAKRKQRMQDWTDFHETAIMICCHLGDILMSQFFGDNHVLKGLPEIIEKSLERGRLKRALQRMCPKDCPNWVANGELHITAEFFRIVTNLIQVNSAPVALRILVGAVRKVKDLLKDPESRKEFMENVVDAPNKLISMFTKLVTSSSAEAEAEMRDQDHSEEEQEEQEGEEKGKGKERNKEYKVEREKRKFAVESKAILAQAERSQKSWKPVTVQYPVNSGVTPNAREMPISAHAEVPDVVHSWATQISATLRSKSSKSLLKQQGKELERHKAKIEKQKQKQTQQQSVTIVEEQEQDKRTAITEKHDEKERKKKEEEKEEEEERENEDSKEQDNLEEYANVFGSPDYDEMLEGTSIAKSKEEVTADKLLQQGSLAITGTVKGVTSMMKFKAKQQQKRQKKAKEEDEEGEEDEDEEENNVIVEE